jgi:hypothetical protein
MVVLSSLSIHEKDGRGGNTDEGSARKIREYSRKDGERARLIIFTDNKFICKISDNQGMLTHLGGRVLKFILF